MEIVAEIVSGIADWVDENEALATGIFVLSVLCLVGPLVLAPWILVRLPADYFQHDRRHRAPTAAVHPALHLVWLVGKNLLGGLLFMTGVLMLFLPIGQGLLTILVSLVLIDFPGKYRVERYLITRPPVWRSANWLRRRAGRPALQID